MRTHPWQTISKVSVWSWSGKTLDGGILKANFFLFGILGEGENDYSWPVEPTDTEDGGDLEEPAADFAPRGASKFQERVRNKLPKPLDTKVAQHSEAIGKFYDACAVCFFDNAS